MDSRLNIPLKGNLWFMNLGTVVPSGNTRRKWNACKEYGFVSAGQTTLDVRYISKLQPEDIICAYESKTGYRAIGRILKRAVPILKFTLNDGRTLHNLPYINMGDRNDRGLFQYDYDDTKCEYIASVHWFDITSNPLWIPKGGPGYYAPRNTVAELKYRETRVALENHFKLKFT
jgi:hypothetical protein